MNALKSLFQTIFSVYFLIMFFIIILFALFVYELQYLLFNTKYENFYKDFLFKGIGTLTCLVAFVSIKKKYHYKYDKNQSYVIVGNHNAAIDIPINTSTCPSEINMKFLSKVENTKLPILGPIVKAMCVLVDRKKSDSKKKSFDLMHKEIKKGYSIFLYPEGTRNKTDNQLKEFYNGAFSLAIEHQIPIVVNTLVGTKKINSSKKTLSLMPGKVVSHWEKPIDTKGLTKADIQNLKEEVIKNMLRRLEE